MTIRTLFFAAIAFLAAGVLAQVAPPAPTPPTPPPPAVPHPLDPLSKEEIDGMYKYLRVEKKIEPYTKFEFIQLVEPSKDEVAKFKVGDPIARKASAIIYDVKTKKTSELVFDLKNSKIISWTEMKGVQANDIGREGGQLDRIVRLDARWQAAIKKRGLDQANVGIGGMPHRGYFPNADDQHRYYLGVSYYDDEKEGGMIDGLFVGVDMRAKKVLWVQDDGTPFVSYDSREYFNDDLLEDVKKREATKTLKIEMPQGASYTLSGNQVAWQNWKFRFSTDPRTGLVLHTVTYHDGDKDRSVLYRASVSELFVPYGDPNWVLMNWFDIGEIGIGAHCLTPLTPGVDAPENAKFFGAVVNTNEGKAREIPNAIALYERDGGILWRHGGDSRRARELVILSVFTVGNYDYCFSWVFHQDGTLEEETLLTGIMQEKATARKTDSTDSHYKPMVAHLVAPNVEAPNHQHFFNFRLDLDVDGTQANRVYEMNTESLPADAKNPRGNGFVMKQTPLRTEKDAIRDINAGSSRRWLVTNPAVTNSLNQPSGYVLVPGENSFPYSAPGSYLRKCAAFTEHQFWATPYNPNELYASGNYVFDGAIGKGLAAWTLANRSIDYEDVVVWYTMGITHVPRVEDWPVMPVHKAGFKLVPAGFFSRNPALDVPKAEEKKGGG